MTERSGEERHRTQRTDAPFEERLRGELMEATTLTTDPYGPLTQEEIAERNRQLGDDAYVRENFPRMLRGDAEHAAAMDLLIGDIAAVLTVYDEHVAPENRGPWRDRLAAFVGHV